MSNYLVTDTDMTSVADAIRTKGGTSAALVFPAGFVSAIGDIPSGGGGSYTVTVSLTNPISPSDFSGCNIYEATINDIEDATSTTPIGTISSETGSTSVTIQSSSYGIVVVPEGNWGASYDPTSDVTCTGKIACIGQTFPIEPSACIFLVGGDGTITIDSIDYGD